MIYLFMNNGGMGNQMFQYAMARKLQKEYGMKIICDLSKFSYKNSDATVREYCLDKFRLSKNMEYRTSYLMKLYYKVKKRLLLLKHDSKENLYFRMTRHGIFSPLGYFDYYPDAKTKCNTIVVNGLFQAHAFFDDVLPELRQEFLLSYEPEEEVKSVLQQMNIEESVCIHWRRGDYLSEQYKDSLLICDESYYNAAIKTIKDKIKSPVFYIFTNSVEDALWISNNVQFDVPVKFVNLMFQDKNNDLDDFRLMCGCKHFIISNSTYSWWAQYLSGNTNKVVCAPSIWNKRENAPGLYFDNWEVIPIK